MNAVINHGYEIGDTVKYLTISNEIRTARITGFHIDETEWTFTGEWVDCGEEESGIWGYVSDIKELVGKELKIGPYEVKLEATTVNGATFSQLSFRVIDGVIASTSLPQHQRFLASIERWATIMTVETRE